MRISFSISRRRFSRRNRTTSSRSSEAIPGRSPASTRACFTQFASVVAETPSSFASASLDLPEERYKSTARSRNSTGHAVFRYAVRTPFLGQQPDARTPRKRDHVRTIVREDVRMRTWALEQFSEKGDELRKGGRPGLGRGEIEERCVLLLIHRL